MTTLSLLLAIVLGLLLLVLAVFGWVMRDSWWPWRPANPFAGSPSGPRVPAVDRRARDKVLKKAYGAGTVPKWTPDVIVVGSGIGGLTTAVVLSRAGKRVLVLEQHDIAGGCCHTFNVQADGGETEFEFEPGIHYIGSDVAITDLLTDGKVAWESLDDHFDVVHVAGKRPFHVPSGEQAFKSALVDRFPSEERAINRFFEEMAAVNQGMSLIFLQKLLPSWVYRFVLVPLGIENLGFFRTYVRSTRETVAEAFDRLGFSDELKAVLGYIWGDYGSPPTEGCFAIHCTVLNHFVKRGAVFPVGGPGQVVYHMVEALRKAGGEVLTSAKVGEIAIDPRGKASGVVMARDERRISCTEAVVAATGVGPLLKGGLCPPDPRLDRALATLSPGPTCCCLFFGLEGSPEELGVRACNDWVFPAGGYQESLACLKKVASLSEEELLSGDWTLPLAFISFPSAKDPAARKRHPNYTTCTVVTMAEHRWFEGWSAERVKRRGEDYLRLKQVVADKMWREVLKIYPQLQGRVLYSDTSSPLSCSFYLGSPKGEIYGLAHNVARFSAGVRPDTGIPGLYLAGQDVVSCGFAGAQVSGLFTASAILHRNCLWDALQARSALYKAKKKNM